MDILNQKKGINMPEEIVHDIPKFMEFNEFKQLSFQEMSVFLNRLISEYQIGVATIDYMLFGAASTTTRRLGSYCNAHKIAIVKALSSHAKPTAENIVRFKNDIAEWRANKNEIIDDIVVQDKNNEKAEIEEETIESNEIETVEEKSSVENSVFAESMKYAIPIPKPETTTMAFESEYIGERIDFDTLFQISTLFKDKKIRVHVSVEAI